MLFALHISRHPYMAADLACIPRILVALTASALDDALHDDPPGEQP